MCDKRQPLFELYNPIAPLLV